MGNTIYTEAAELRRASNPADPDSIHVRIRTDDLGPSNAANVHLFERLPGGKVGKVVDLPVTWAAKLGTDDVFEGTFEVPAGMDSTKLAMTAFVDGAGDRIWEGRDVKVQPITWDRRDGLYLSNATLAGSSRIVTGKGGEVSAGFLRNPMQGYPSAEGKIGLTKLSYIDHENFFNGAAELYVVVTPRLSVSDAHDILNPSDDVTKTLTDGTQANIVKMTKQSDGTYLADATIGLPAPYSPTLLTVDETSDYWGGGDKQSLESFMLAVFDKETGKWDSNNSQDYALPNPASWAQLQANQ